jgi:hypothetical protein
MGLQRTTDQQLDEASDGLPAHRGSTFKRCPVRVDTTVRVLVAPAKKPIGLSRCNACRRLRRCR